MEPALNLIPGRARPGFIRIPGSAVDRDRVNFIQYNRYSLSASGVLRLASGC